jgi:aldehyde:ferredoxin oxidoreductase
MLKEKGPKVLTIDLSSERADAVWRPDLSHWLGGSGLATALLGEEIKPDKGVFSEDQPIIMTIGPMTAIYPVVTKVVAMFRSPLTGGIGESHAGMRLGMAMRFAGYDAIIIKGKANKPTYLVIDTTGVKFKPAGPLWGTDTEESGRILREQESGRGHRSCMRIGQAGERLISFAGVNVDTYRHFGRLGLGAVFGSKLLKAVVIEGDQSQSPISNPPEFRKVYNEIFERVTDTEMMEKYHGLGTAGNVLTLNQIKSLPTRNLQASEFDGAGEISGEAFAEHNLLRKLACAGCPIGCIHLALYRRSFGDASQEYEFNQIAYDHELIYALGALLGIANRSDILSLILEVERAGLDAMATGVSLAWATEGMEKGLLSEGDLLGRLSFGDAEGYLKAIRELVKQKHPFYQDMALGTEALANKYGGRDFALTLAGNEVAGYHTGYANIAGQALGARHSHLDNAGYSFDQEKEKVTIEKLAEKIIAEEIERNALSSLCICFFARKVYDFTTVVKALNAIDINWGEQALRDLGTQIFLQKRMIKARLGFDPSAIRIPRRFFQTPSFNGMLDADSLERLMVALRTRTDELSRQNRSHKQD